MIGMMEKRITSNVCSTIEAIMQENRKKSDKQFKELLDAFESKLDEIVDAKINARMEKINDEFGLKKFKG